MESRLKKILNPRALMLALALTTATVTAGCSNRAPQTAIEAQQETDDATEAKTAEAPKSTSESEKGQTTDTATKGKTEKKAEEDKEADATHE